MDNFLTQEEIDLYFTPSHYDTLYTIFTDLYRNHAIAQETKEWAISKMARIAEAKRANNGKFPVLQYPVTKEPDTFSDLLDY